MGLSRTNSRHGSCSSRWNERERESVGFEQGDFPDEILFSKEIFDKHETIEIRASQLELQKIYIKEEETL